MSILTLIAVWVTLAEEEDSEIAFRETVRQPDRCRGRRTKRQTSNLF